MTRTRESANQHQIDTYSAQGPVQFGPWTSNIWRHDPRHLLFLLARYKFAAKMLSGREKVLEVGCGDGIGLPVLRQEVRSVHAIDAEPLVLSDAEKRAESEGATGCTFELVDLTTACPKGQFDGALSLDVIEHIPGRLEESFMANLTAVLSPHAVCLIGTPNATAAPYASKDSKEAHVNLKHAQELRALMAGRFHNVFMFSMNDEVVHTGFSPMAHYLFGMGVGVR